MSLVPVDENLVAEVLIRNEDVGFVHEGQRVKVKLAAYPFQKYGMIDGTVRRISADAAQTDQKASSLPRKNAPTVAVQSGRAAGPPDARHSRVRLVVRAGYASKRGDT